jgi:hypothetical protein
MSQDRILGSSATIEIYSSSGPISFGEIDSFNAEPEHELKKFHPLGQVEEHGQVIYKGWKLSFKGGMINGDLDKIQEAIDTALLSGQSAPRYRITETIIMFNGVVNTWVYDNALIYNLKNDVSNSADEIKQDLSGWAPKRVRG